MNLDKLRSLPRQSAIVLLLLTLAALLGFAVVNRLTRKFQHHEQDLANYLFSRGEGDLKAGNPQHAIADLSAALRYDPDNYRYQLVLAKALLATDRVDQAHFYLITLWNHSPQDGEVNYLLARVAEKERNGNESIRYYHNSIYGVWKDDPDNNRRQARFSLVDFLLARGSSQEAQAELIAMSAALAPDPGLHIRVANDFMRAGDQSHALEQYREALRLEPKNVNALTGAGEAAFGLRQYETARNYLEDAVKAGSGNASIDRLLNTAQLVVNNDPLQPRISDADRSRRTLAVLDQLGERLRD